ncbi:hypothetical protein K437DRAFT_114081 [Tilletiaria anomala UBC 951]|uniref:Uncharacterized protein n=1 Tax=Tilletiaria anomala (strain ATCC 24038 / CBS 436.72 / UBC 951) TaxID=1037660 RepID=A0A066W061_TILAU|nr:uncharacterized protein K437DRAFT_114081 [Tilletiaria anomala UBC 951]KDN45913.1 hypothetical protein K437DRAFT_114081 [Tilletiaria anomala UBC 951]
MCRIARRPRRSSIWVRVPVRLCFPHAPRRGRRHTQGRRRCVPACLRRDAYFPVLSNGRALKRQGALWQQNREVVLPLLPLWLPCHASSLCRKARRDDACRWVSCVYLGGQTRLGNDPACSVMRARSASAPRGQPVIVGDGLAGRIVKQRSCRGEYDARGSLGYT